MSQSPRRHQTWVKTTSSSGLKGIEQRKHVEAGAEICRQHTEMFDNMTISTLAWPKHNAKEIFFVALQLIAWLSGYGSTKT